MLIRKIPIRSRFFLLSVFSVLLWLFAGLLLFSYLETFSHDHQISMKINGLTSQVLQMENTLHDFRQQDVRRSDFYETGNSDYINQLSQLYINTYNQVNELKTHPGFRKAPLITQKLNNLSNYLYSLDELAKELISRVREHGNSNYGLHNQVTGQLQNLYNLSYQNRPGDVENLVNELEWMLNDYLPWPGLIKAQQMSDLVNQIISSLQAESNRAGTSSNNSDISRMLASASALQNNLTELTELDKSIGYSTFEGLQGDIKRNFDIIIEEINAMDYLAELNISSKQRKTGYGLLTFILLAIISSGLFIISLSRSLQWPLSNLMLFIREMASGKLPDPYQCKGNDEFSGIADDLNTLTGNLKEKIRFASEIRVNENTALPDMLSEDDALGRALLDMGDHLQSIQAEDRKHKAESEKRRWINEGLAKFEEILRIHSSQLDVLADNVIKNLVKYLNASIGGLFLTDPGTGETLELISAFAYDRKKYLVDKFSLGEGLVGTCAIEKQKIFITDVPDDYVRVSSGIGDSRPKSLLLVPLKLENELLGVMEIASMLVLQDHEIEFVEKIGESIASAVSAVRINMRTSQLLQQSQEQAREMAEQEEKLRMQMEELQATQEESARRESEITGILNGIHNSSLVAEYNMNEELIEINDKFLLLLETQRDHILGKKYNEIIGVSRHTDDYKKFWQTLSDGKTISNVEKIKLVTGNEIWLRQTYSPILDKDGSPFKILNIATDISETIRQQESLKRQASEISRANVEMQTFSDAVDQAIIKCVYSPAGQILEVNENYEKVTGYSQKEMVGKNNRIFLQRSEKDQFEKIWNDVVKNKPYRGVIRRTKPTGEQIWIMSTFTPVKDEDGTIFKVYFLGQDITERKLKYQLLEEANNEIERLKKQIERG